MDIKIRGLDKTVVDRLNELAEKKGQSRESYLRDVLTSLSIAGELMELDFKYANLVETLTDNSKMMADIIDKNTYVLDEVLGRLDGDRNGGERM